MIEHITESAFIAQPYEADLRDVNVALYGLGLNDWNHALPVC